MGYVGRGLNQEGGQYRKLDDISSTFNGSNTSFSLAVSNVAVTPTAQNLLISINGVIQEPGSAFSINGSTITFTEAPASDSTFFGVVMGEASFIAHDTVGANEMGVTAGTVKASRGVVVDSSKDVSGFNQVTSTTFSGIFSGALSSSAQIASNISGSVAEPPGNVSGSSTSTGSFGKVEVGSGKITTAGNMTLDADGAQFRFEDGGTEFGRISRVSSDLVIKSISNNNDILFKGVDGSSTITALQLDMSEAGNAIFNNDVTIAGTLTAQEIHTEFTSASILFTSGSTKTGNSLDDVHTVTGSMRVSSSLGINGVPTNPLHIVGSSLYASTATNLSTSTTTAAVRIQGSRNASTSIWAGTLANDAQTYLQACNGAGNSADDLVLNPFGGNVGIGIGNASPSVNLQIGGTTPTIYLGDSGAEDTKLVYRGNQIDYYIGHDDSNNALTMGFGTTVGSDAVLAISGSKVGIGTTSPEFPLNIESTTGGSIVDVIAIGNKSTSANTEARMMFTAWTAYGNGAIGVATDGSSAHGDMKFYTHNGSSLGEKMRITYGGHVGIGTSSPSTATNVLLSVGDTSLGYAGMEFIAGTNAERWRLYTSYNDDSEAIWGLYSVTDAVYRFLVHEDGAMGIGTSSPSGNLQVEGSNGAQLKLSSAKTSIGGTDPLGVIEFVSNDGSSGRSGTMARIYAFIHIPTDTHTTNIDGSANEGTSLSFQTGIDTSGSTSMTVSEKMRLDKTGNLGIGAVSFGPRLYSIVADSEYAAYFTSDENNGSTASVGIRSDSTSGDRKLVTFWNGGGVISDISYNGSTVTYGGTSDKRLKENIDDYNGGLSLLNQVEVKKFDWITGRKQDVGVIAQDLYNTIPKVIIKGDDNETDIEQPWQVDYPRLVPYLINAVQELSSEITDLKKEVEELKS